MKITPMLGVNQPSERSRDPSAAVVDSWQSPLFAPGHVPGAVNVPGLSLGGIGAWINGGCAPAAGKTETDEDAYVIGELDVPESIGADEVLASLDDPAMVMPDTTGAST